MKKFLSVLLSVLVAFMGLLGFITEPAGAEEFFTKTLLWEDFTNQPEGDFSQVKISADTKTSELLSTAGFDTSLLRLPALGEWGPQYRSGYYGAARMGDLYYKNTDGSQATEPTSDGEYWFAGRHAIKVENENGTNKYLSLYATESNNAGFSMGLGDLESKTDYILTFKVKLESGKIMPRMHITSSINGVALQDTQSVIYNTTKITEASKTYAGGFTATGSWQEGKITFNSGDFKKAYLFVSLTENIDTTFKLDDIKYEKKSKSIEVFEKGKIYSDNGVTELLDTNEYFDISYTVNGGNSAFTAIGDKIKATALYNADNNANEFLGWYKNGLHFSNDSIIEFEVEEGVIYSPKLKSKNLLGSSASYENLDVGTSLAFNDGTKYPEGNLWGYSGTSGYFRATKEETVYGIDGTAYQQTESGNIRESNECSFTVVGDKAYTGKKSLHFGTSRNVPSLTLDVDKNTDYTLTYWILAENIFKENESDGILDSIITTTINVSANSGADEIKQSLVDLSNENLIVSRVVNRDEHNLVDWVKVTHSFNSGDFKKLYLSIRSTNTGKNTIGFFIDDISLVKAENSFFSGLAYNSIRPTDNALRFKLNIDEVLNNKDSFMGGYVTEIGFLATRKSLLNGAELLPTASKVKMVAGWTRDGSIDKSFKDEGETGTHLRAALTGIGRFTGGRVDYDYLGYDYSVRLYVRLEVLGSEKLIYGTVSNASVFAYCEYVLGEFSKGHTDYNSVETFINSKETDTEGDTVLSAYNRYLENKNSK